MLVNPVAGASLAAALTTLGLCAQIAIADVRPAEPGESMQTYYTGERGGGLWLIGMGAIGIGTGAYLYTRDTDFSAGVSYPVLGVGVVHAAAGVYLMFASKRRIETFNGEIHSDAAAFVESEHDRIGGVKTQFLVLEIVEVALIAGGVGLAIYGEREDRPTLGGVGLGLGIQAAATLVFDIIAARRAGRYHRALAGLRVSAAPDGCGGSAVAAGFTTAF